MKRLFRWLLILGVAAGAVYGVTTLMRRRSTATQIPEWSPPTVEPAIREPEPEEAAAESEGMASPEAAADAAIAGGDVVEAAPVAPEPTSEALAVADDEGMTAPSDETNDAAIGSSGEIQGVVEPQTVDDGPAAAEAEGMTAPAATKADAFLDAASETVEASTQHAGLEEPTHDEIASAEDEGMAVPDVEPPVDLSLDSAGEIVAPEEAPAAEADAPDFAAMMDSAVHEAEVRAEVAPEAPAEAAPEKDFLTTYFEELAATPVAEEAREEEEGGELLESVEQALTDLEPAAIVPPPRRTAESYLDEGNVYFNVGQYGLAIERYTQAVELDSNLTAAFYNRANARTRSGDFDGALADYDRALELQPNDADALNNRGMLHLYRANYTAALRDFNGALDADPSDTTVMVNRGLAHLHGGDAPGALVDFQEAIRMDSSDAAAHYGAAQAAAALGNRAEALRFIQRTLELDGGYAREAAADPRLEALQGDDEFLRMLRQAGSRSG